jgi:lipoprotein-anchoring transpeptidase ErfK/SrfK
MLRKILAVGIAATMVFAILPTVSQAEIASKTNKQIVLKKKKHAMKASAGSFITGAIDKPIVRPDKPQVSNLTPCVSFFRCLFGRRHRTVQVQVQQASFAKQPTALSRKTTRKSVAWSETKYPVGSLVVRTPERALYYVSGSGEAIRYSVGVGREGMQWSGNSRIVAKAEWPSWTPPQVMIEREAAKGHIIPPFMEGGPGNPLGARALYIGGRMYRVHGTNNESSIGGAVSSGCIRMMNADVVDLYDRVKVGAKIYVYQ